ncbi:MAG: Jag N-terminal domain-containing protein [Desulfarculus sp.]|nr:Jag N-terminal domain-containing protein [Desulfarculus sp.]
MSDFTEFVGKTTEEALQKATAHFALPLNRLEVEVVSAGSSGLFGFLGAKKAKVRVRPLAGSGLEAEMAELAAVVSENHRPRAPRPSAAMQNQPAPARPAPPPAPAGNGGQPDLTVMPPMRPPAPGPSAGQDPSDMTEVRQARPAPEASVATAPPPASPAPPESPALPRDLASAEAAEAEEPEEEAVPGAEDEAPPDQRLEQDPLVIAHAREVLERLVAPLDGTAQVTAVSGSQGIELAVQGQDAGVLIGRRGQNLEALQYLVTRIVSHRCGRPVRIVVDAGEYRRRRRESLEDLAQRMAHKARQTGKPVAVGPLSAQERRVVHLTLKGQAGLSTSSRGRGELKKVVITPSRPGAPGGA